MAGFLSAGDLSFPKPVFPLYLSPSPQSWRHTLVFLLLMVISALVSLLPRLTLNLGSLAQRGRWKIAHDSSFVHPNGRPSTAPDPILVQNLLKFATKTGGGFNLRDMAMFHLTRAKSATQPLDGLHSQIALGECALTWEMLHAPGNGPTISGGGFVPVSRLEQWFGEERLPDNWWGDGGDAVRPKKVVGLVETRKLATFIGQLAEFSGPTDIGRW